MKNKRTTWCHLLFYFTSYVLNMFQTLIYPSSGACNYSVESPHRVIFFLVQCVLEIWCGWVGVVSMLQPATRIPFQPNHTESPTHIGPRKIRPYVVIQQNSRKLLMMDILMSETCWAHKKWNKIASDIKLVFYSSNITMMHSPINIRFVLCLMLVFIYWVVVFV